MIKFTAQLLNKLVKSECAEHKCSYCWEAANEINGEYYCKNCDVKVDDWHEII
jgi:hypothetical protein